MAVYVTGDTHGPIDYHKLNADSFKKRYNVSGDDSVIIAGDFGGVWYGNQKDNYILNWYASNPWTTYFVDGNHENFDALEKYPVALQNGAICHQIRDNVFHVMRGEILTLEGKKFFCFGGATSHDKEYRKEGVSWWKQENPSDAEYVNGLKNISRAGLWEVDYVITHCAPASIVKQIASWMEIDTQSEWFEVLMGGIIYKKWYFGHYHIDREIDDKHTALYYNIERVV